MTIFLLTHGSFDECNIVGVFSSKEKADEFRKTTKVNANTEYLTFELDPPIPEQYTSGKTPWSIVIEMRNGKVKSCHDCSDLGRPYSDEAIKAHTPHMRPKLNHEVEDTQDYTGKWTVPANDELRVLCWATNEQEAKAHAMAMRTQHLATKAFMPCTKCGKPTNRIVCDDSEGMEAEHDSCGEPAWISNAKPKAITVEEPVAEPDVIEEILTSYVRPDTVVEPLPEGGFIKFGKPTVEDSVL